MNCWLWVGREKGGIQRLASEKCQVHHVTGFDNLK